MVTHLGQTEIESCVIDIASHVQPDGFGKEILKNVALRNFKFVATLLDAILGQKIDGSGPFKEESFFEK